MSWALGYDERWKRDIGYGVPCICDHPNCNEKIDRGLSYVCCRQQPYGGEDGCGLYFCSAHQNLHGKCERCAKKKSPFDAKPDAPEWMRWKLRDHSWKKWRESNPEDVAAIRKALRGARK